MNDSKFLTIYLLTALLSLVGVTLTTWDSIHDHRKVFNKHFTQILLAQQRLYEIHTEKTFETLEQIASIYAENVQIQQVFRKGRKAVEDEGGGAGGVEAARLRAELYNLVGVNWKKTHKQDDMRCLQFHLAPGATSFLRVHYPEKFGDNLDSLRHSIVHANTAVTKVHGFEIGRIVSGLRGIVPIFAPDPESGEQRHVGAVETCISFLPIIRILNNEHFEAGGHSHGLHATVLLNENHLRKIVWPEFLEKWYNKDRFIDGYFIETSIQLKKVQNILLSLAIKKAVSIHGVHSFEELQPPLALISIPLHDFQSEFNQTSEHFGHILIWLDISLGLKELHASINKSIRIAILAELFILIFTFYALRSLSRHLQQVLRLNTSLKEKAIETDAQRKALLTSEKRFRNIVETSTDWIWETDADNIYTYASPSVKNILGFTPDEILGQNAFDLLQASEMGHSANVFQAFVNKKQPVTNVENTHLHKNGREVLLSTSALPILSEDRKLIGYRGINRDITAKKATDKLRQAKEAAELANKTKSEFLANMSHELRTPMHGILSYANFGIQRLNKVPPKKILEYFHEIADSGNRLVLLLNDLLDLAKLESGKMSYTITKQDIYETITSVTNEFQAAIEEKKLQLRVDLLDEPLTVNFDIDRISQVLRNLLSNSIKFTEPGKQIRIEARKKTICLNGGKQPVIQVSVIDQGIGIPTEELETIFNKFVQSSKTRTGAGGTGLGLAICEQIIEDHKGVIGVRKTLEGETLFYFTLPCT